MKYFKDEIEHTFFLSGPKFDNNNILRGKIVIPYKWKQTVAKVHLVANLSPSSDSQMLRSSCSLLFHNPAAVLAAYGGAPPSIRRPFSASAFCRNATSSTTIEKQSPATAYSIPATDLGKRIKIQPSAELGLLSILFVLSMAIGAITSVALISIPTASAMKRLAVSMENLASLASEEVPGTLRSLRLSRLEIVDLTRQLAHLRLWISGNQYGDNSRKK